MISLSPPTICNSATSALPAAGREFARTPKRERIFCPRRSANGDGTRKSVCSNWTSDLATVTHFGQGRRELPDAILTESGAENHPLDAAICRTQAIDQTSQLLPRTSRSPSTRGRGRLDGLQPPLHREGRGRAKEQDVAAVAILGDAINLGAARWPESEPRPDPHNCHGCKHGIRDETLFGGLGRNWSTASIATPLPPTGATATSHPPMASALPRGWPGRKRRARQPVR